MIFVSRGISVPLSDIIFSISVSMVSTLRSVSNSRVSEVSEIILTFLCFNAVRSVMDGSLKCCILQ